METFHRFLNLLPLFLIIIFTTSTLLHRSSAKYVELKIFSNPRSFTPKTVHDLLPEYGFPKGLIPDAVKSYSLSDNGDFQVELERSCYVHFDNLVYYDKKITGKLKYGSICDVSGIQAKKAFLWVPITGIQSDTNSGFIEFNVGFLSEKLPADQFQDIPICKSKACGNRKEVVGEMISEASVEAEENAVSEKSEVEIDGVDTLLQYGRGLWLE